MTSRLVQVRELAGWDWDDYEYRPSVACLCAQDLLGRPSCFSQEPALRQTETDIHLAALQHHAGRTDLLAEMNGLKWSLGIVDLRCLLAFQRRLILSPLAPHRPVPGRNDWTGLVEFCLGPTKPAVYDVVHEDPTTVIFRSESPNLHMRLTTDIKAPILMYCGSPFLEVACYRDRWFLRDGYHRAYTLLRSGVALVPAVVVWARTLAELGAIQPWFFSENILFSSRPPQVIDFLNDLLTVQYDRPRLMKTVRITIDESLAPETFLGEQR